MTSSAYIRGFVVVLTALVAASGVTAHLQDCACCLPEDERDAQRPVAQEGCCYNGQEPAARDTAHFLQGRCHCRHGIPPLTTEAVSAPSHPENGGILAAIPATGDAAPPAARKPVLSFGGGSSATVAYLAHCTLLL